MCVCFDCFVIGMDMEIGKMLVSVILLIKLVDVGYCVVGFKLIVVGMLVGVFMCINEDVE